MMAPALRKFALTSHVVASVGWAGALAVFLAHAIVSVSSQDVQTVRAASLAMEVAAWFVILPLSIAAMATGLIQALGTAWGLFRHYWVMAKVLLTLLATTVLLLKLEPIGHLARAAAETTFSVSNLAGLRISLLVHAAGGLLVLLGTAALAIYKPQGLTQYGQRKLRERTGVGTMPQPGPDVSMPRWVKVLGAVLAALLLLVGIMMLGGGHGPHAHAAPGG